MGRDENGKVISSMGAVKWNLITGEKTPYDKDNMGWITVNEGDVIGFTKDCIPASELHIYGSWKDSEGIGTWMQIQINENSENPILLDCGPEHIISGVNIRYLVARCKMWLTFWGISFDD